MRTKHRLERILASTCLLALITAPSFAQGGATGQSQGTPPPKSADTKKGQAGDQGSGDQPPGVQGPTQGPSGVNTGADAGQGKKPGEQEERSPTIGELHRNKPIPDGCWFKKIHHDFGKHYESSKEKVLKVSYDFTNTTGKPQKISAIVPSCKCQQIKLVINGKEQNLTKKSNFDDQLKTPIEVPAGAKGKLEMGFDIGGGSGLRTGDVRFDTSDEKMPSFAVTCEASILPAYELDPGIVDLGTMAPTEFREWKVKVRCNVRKDWKIKSALEPHPAGMVIGKIERKTDEKGAIFYEISGKYGPNLEEGAAGGNIIFATDDSAQNLLVEVRAQVRERIKLSRSFVSFKSFLRNKAQEQSFFVWPSDYLDPKSSLKPTRVEIVTSTIPKDFVVFEIIAPKTDGELKDRKVPGVYDPLPAAKVWEIKIKLKAGVPGRGRIGVKCKLHFEGEGLVPKNFRFNGFPRG